MSHQGLLRFSTAGSVDDGKSTLIGRLLFDAKSIFEDQFSNLVRTTANRGGVGGNVASDLAVDLALLTDGLMAEREQGITIDVAYRYFATPERKFIIADTPGHEQYTRNMVTGASTADLTIILVDAAKGVRPQSRRHALVAGLLGIRNIVVAVNKMDLVNWSYARFAEIKSEFETLTAKLNLQNVTFIPLSALEGDMVVDRGERLGWYEGPTLLEVLHRAPAGPAGVAEFRFPVQLVSRPGIEGAYTRGYMGRIESGSIAVGDPIVVQPSGRHSRIADIVTYDGSLESARAPASVTLLLEDELDISRGDMICLASDPAPVLRTFSAMVCWMDAERLDRRRKYLVKQATRTTKALIEGVDHGLDIENFEPTPKVDLAMNEIGQVRFKVRDPLPADPYVSNRATGGFILIDEVTNHTVAAGMILPSTQEERDHG
ncbi:MAG: GTP-binding protein [Burkholderiaceae bacterium]|jgi:sulfate adenylyltransferase subunit 1